MGRFVNPDNSAFQVALNSRIYVDKTGLLEYTNTFLDTIYYIPVLLALQYIVIYSASSMAVVTECDILSFCLIKKRLRSNVNIQSIH